MILRTYAKWIDGSQNDREMARLETALIGDDDADQVKQDSRAGFSCLCGSELRRASRTLRRRFLSCLRGSEPNRPASLSVILLSKLPTRQ